MDAPIREEEIDFRAFITESHDMQCVAGTDGRFYWLNDAWERVLGWSSDELKSKPFLEFVHPEDVQETLSEVGKLAQGKPTIRFLNRYAHKEGGHRWLEWVTRPTSQGVLYAIARDVTDLKQALGETRRQLELLQMAELVSGVGHWRVAMGEQHIYWSPQVYAIHGRDRETYLPTLEDGVRAYHPDDRDAVAKFVEDAIEDKTGFDFQLRIIRHNDGEVRLVRSAGQPELDADGNVVALFGVFQDVTEQVGDLRRRNEELERFAYAAAHDLQAPLKTVRGFGELLRDELGDELSDDAELYLERMLRSSRRMSRLTEGLLSFAHTTRSGRDRSEVDLAKVAAGAVEALDAELRATAGEVRVEALPVVFGDEVQLGSLLQNLISNAIRYRSEAPPRIVIRSRAEGSRWRIEVQDNGRGFEMSHAERVFALFQRLEPRADGDVERPLGLGLSLCKRIVTAHGGSIGARSKPGAGATFHFTLPVHRKG